MDDCVIIWGSNGTRQSTGRQLAAGESYNLCLVSGTTIHVQMHMCNSGITQVLMHTELCQRLEMCLKI